MKMFHIEGHFHYTVCANSIEEALDAEYDEDEFNESLETSAVWEDPYSEACDDR